VKGDVDVAAAAALIGEPARAALLLALTEETALPASEHLARLVAGGLIVGERQGRYVISASPTLRSRGRSKRCR
jgi:hypothetical protein